jgi:hypothetical protein
VTYRDLCPPCRDLFDRWSVAPMTRGGIRIMSIGQDNPRNVVDANRARADDHYALINRQCEGVLRSCAAGNHAPPREA